MSTNRPTKASAAADHDIDDDDIDCSDIPPLDEAFWSTAVLSHGGPPRQFLDTAGTEADSSGTNGSPIAKGGACAL